MKYYVYELIVVPDGSVCYIGKGSSDRMHRHRKRALNMRYRHQSYLYQHLNFLLRSGKDFIATKVYETENEAEALAEEQKRIQYYGACNLLNWNQYHTGTLATQIKESRRLACAAAARQMWRDPSYRSNNHTVKGLKFAYRPKEKLRAPKRSWGKHGKGVSKWCVPNKSVRWQARITILSKTVYLGYFPSASLAATAYDNACDQHYHTRPNGTSKE